MLTQENNSNIKNSENINNLLKSREARINELESEQKATSRRLEEADESAKAIWLIISKVLNVSEQEVGDFSFSELLARVGDVRDLLETASAATKDCDRFDSELKYLQKENKRLKEALKDLQISHEQQQDDQIELVQAIQNANFQALQISQDNIERKEPVQLDANHQILDSIDQNNQMRILNNNFERLLQIKYDVENDNSRLRVENELLKKESEEIKQSNQEKTAEIARLKEMIVAYKTREQLLEREAEQLKNKITRLEGAELDLTIKIERYKTIDRAISELYAQTPSSDIKYAEITSLNKLAQISAWVNSFSNDEKLKIQPDSESALIKQYQHLLHILVEDGEAIQDFKFLEELFNNLKDLAIVNKKLETDILKSNHEKNAQNERIEQLTKSNQSLSANLENFSNEITRIQKTLEEKAILIKEYDKKFEIMKADIQTMRNQTNLIREYEEQVIKLESPADRALLKDLSLRTASAALMIKFPDECNASPESKEAQKKLKEYEDLIDTIKTTIRKSESHMKCVKALTELLHDQGMASHLLHPDKDSTITERVCELETKIKELESENASCKEQIKVYKEIHRDNSLAAKNRSEGEEPEATRQKRELSSKQDAQMNERKARTSSQDDHSLKAPAAIEDQKMKQELYKKDQIIANLKGQLNFLKAIVKMIADIKQEIYNNSADEQGMSWKIQKLKFLIDNFEKTQTKLDEKTITTILAQSNSKGQQNSGVSIIQEELTKASKIIEEIKETVFEEAVLQNSRKFLKKVRALLGEEQVQEDLEEEENKVDKAQNQWWKSQ